MSKPQEGPTRSPLRATKTLVTTHDSSGLATLFPSPSRPSSSSSHLAKWTPYENGSMFFNEIFTNTFGANLNYNMDIISHEMKMSSRGGRPGLVSKSGTVCRQVDFAPGYICAMHRTQSLDFGVVIEGQVDMLLDDGTQEKMYRGDVAVQRGTMHAWRNPSETEWARMMFVLQDIKPLVINGKKYGEDLGTGTDGLPPSDNVDDDD